MYVAVAMTGLGFVSFLVLDNSAISYIVIDTLLLGAFGSFDLFWWSVFGEMLDYGYWFIMQRIRGAYWRDGRKYDL
mgnify:CR=1 FL=1